MIVGEAGGLVSFGTEVSAGFVMVKHGYPYQVGMTLAYIQTTLCYKTITALLRVVKSGMG